MFPNWKRLAKTISPSVIAIQTVLQLACRACLLRRPAIPEVAIQISVPNFSLPLMTISVMTSPDLQHHTPKANRDQLQELSLFEHNYTPPNFLHNNLKSQQFSPAHAQYFLRYSLLQPFRWIRHAFFKQQISKTSSQWHLLQLKMHDSGFFQQLLVKDAVFDLFRFSFIHELQTQPNLSRRRQISQTISHCTHFIFPIRNLFSKKRFADSLRHKGIEVWFVNSKQLLHFLEKPHQS